MKLFIHKGIKVIAALTIVSVLASGCGQSAQPASSQSSGEAVVLKVGASPVPHSEILKIAKEELAKENINLEIIEYTDYVQPNLALDSGDLDANFFQHLPYLEDFNAENDTKLSSVVAVHFEPLSIYPGKTSTLSSLPEGGTIAIPNDTTNEARALLLLESIGFITMPEGSGLTVTPKDITENPKNLAFEEIEAALVPNVLQDVDLGVINGNYAIGAGLKATDALKSEDVNSIAAQTYANIIAIRTGDETRPEIQALVKAVTSKSVADFINSEYSGLVVPMFE